MNCIKNYEEISFNASSKPLWDMYSDTCLQEITEQFLHHLIRLLNIFSHIIEETIPILPPNKPVLPNLPPASALSPIKRRSKSDASDLKMKSVPIIKHTPGNLIIEYLKYIVCQNNNKKKDMKRKLVHIYMYTYIKYSVQAYF